MDGILIVPTNQGHEFTQFLSSLQLPVVAIGNKLSPAIPFVGIQDREAMRAAVELVAQKGYRRIIYVSPPLSYRGKENIYEVEERFEGFREAVKVQALESVVIREKHFADSLPDVVMKSHLRTAIMCSSDIYALQCLDSLGSWGMRVPEDVGLIGFDDIDVLKYVKPALTSISYPVTEIVKQAFALLKRLMDGERGPMSPPLVETNIVFRESL